MPIDMNGDALPDFYQLTECDYERMKSNGIGDVEICQNIGRVRVQSWLNTGGLIDGRGGFIANTDFTFPAGASLPWLVASTNLVVRASTLSIPKGAANGSR
jgi:hypothetical protein